MPINDLNKSTPLHSAAGSGNLALCKYLIKESGGLNLVNRSGNTPLFYSIGNIKVFRFFYYKQNDKNPRRKLGYQRTLLHEAARYKCLSACKEILQNLKPEERMPKDGEGRTPIYLAAEQNDPWFVEEYYKITN